MPKRRSQQPTSSCGTATAYYSSQWMSYPRAPSFEDPVPPRAGRAPSFENQVPPRRRGGRAPSFENQIPLPALVHHKPSVDTESQPRRSSSRNTPPVLNTTRGTARVHPLGTVNGTFYSILLLYFLSIISLLWVLEPSLTTYSHLRRGYWPPP